MNGDVYRRLLTLVGLAALGVGLAWAGTAIGVGEPVSETGPGVTFAVDEDGVTLSDDRRNVTVMDDLSGVETIAITDAGDRFHIRTETRDSLTNETRDRAIAIARDNRSVRHALADVGRYELSVEPITKLNSGSARTIEIDDINASAANASQAATFTVETVSTGDDSKSVTIDRSPTAETQAVVRANRPGSNETVYAFVVDLTTETVVEVEAKRHLQ
ncbi:hypothetical protein [Halorussus ruber]|uniref:hypothetical protein n=1 Tax=Halorussus ruber TaxID=1126238 RepID=UPI001091C6D1|nr:hypothetical protein [Halorussus ruber]